MRVVLEVLLYSGAKRTRTFSVNDINLTQPLQVCIEQVFVNYRLCLVNEHTANIQLQSDSVCRVIFNLDICLLFGFFV